MRGFVRFACITSLCLACAPKPPDSGESEGEATGEGTSDASATVAPPTEATTTPDPPDPTTSVGTTNEPVDPTEGDNTTGVVCDPAGLTPLSRDELLTLLSDDLAALDPAARPTTRYLVLAHMRDPLCDENYRWAASKLLNSLSNQPAIAPPTPIGADGLALRIDLRDYGWDSSIKASDGSNYQDTWAMLVDSVPYAVEPEGPLAEALQDAADTAVPFLPLDAVLAFAGRPPLYYDILRVPKSLLGLEVAFDLDLDAAVDDERESDLDIVARAGFSTSGIAFNHRIVERHDLPAQSGRALWRTHDFDSNAGDNNFFAFPFDFTADGSELFWHLPNGLQAYMSVDSSGNRRNESPVDIIQDQGSEDSIVSAGLSCVGCHAQGVISIQDDLRHDIDLSGTNDFTPAEVEEIRNVYPTRDEFAQLLGADRQRFAEALSAAGVPTDLAIEPMSVVSAEFQLDLDLQRAAAELWIAPADLAAALDTLSPELAGLKDGVVARDTFTANFAATVCALELGSTSACP